MWAWAPSPSRTPPPVPPPIAFSYRNARLYGVSISPCMHFLLRRLRAALGRDFAHVYCARVGRCSRFIGARGATRVWRALGALRARGQPRGEGLLWPVDHG